MNREKMLQTVNHTLTTERFEILEQQPTPFTPSETFVSNEVRQMTEYVVEYSLTLAFCLLGIFGNVINIIIFYNLGYKETINISLTSIAFWDLVNSTCGFFHRTRGFMKAILSTPLSMTYDNITLFTFGFLSSYSLPTSAVLTSYVALERCLCVSMPFAVKYLLTQKVVTSVNITLSAVFFVAKCMTYIGERIEWVYYEKYNTTVAIITHPPSVNFRILLLYNDVVSFGSIVTSVVVQCSCFFIVSYHLRKSAKFRTKSAASIADDLHKTKAAISSRDSQVIRMLLVIIFVYLIGLLPNVIIDVGKMIDRKFYIWLEYHNLFLTCYYFACLCFHINASVNIFIYYSMSSQYKAKLREKFKMKPKMENNKWKSNYRIETFSLK